jgi:hypothetical protein
MKRSMATQVKGQEQTFSLAVPFKSNSLNKSLMLTRSENHFGDKSISFASHLSSRLFPATLNSANKSMKVWPFAETPACTSLDQSTSLLPYFTVCSKNQLAFTN